MHELFCIFKSMQFLIKCSIDWKCKTIWAFTPQYNVYQKCLAEDFHKFCFSDCKSKIITFIVIMWWYLKTVSMLRPCLWNEHFVHLWCLILTVLFCKVRLVFITIFVLFTTSYYRLNIERRIKSHIILWGSKNITRAKRA